MNKTIFIVTLGFILVFGTVISSLARGETTIGSYDTECYYNDKIIAYEDLTYREIFEDNNLVDASFQTNVSGVGGSLSIDNNKAIIIGNGTIINPRLRHNNTLELLTNHKYYINVRTRVLQNTVSITYYANSDYATYLKVDNPIPNQWYDMIKIATMTTDRTNFNIAQNYLTASESTAKILEIERFYIIDLSIFDVEPTQEQMDNLLETYLDKQGEKTICFYEHQTDDPNDIDGYDLGQSRVRQYYQMLVNPLNFFTNTLYYGIKNSKDVIMVFPTLLNMKTNDEVYSREYYKDYNFVHYDSTSWTNLFTFKNYVTEHYVYELVNYLDGYMIYNPLPTVYDGVGYYHFDTNPQADYNPQYWGKFPQRNKATLLSGEEVEEFFKIIYG